MKVGVAAVALSKFFGARIAGFSGVYMGRVPGELLGYFSALATTQVLGKHQYLCHMLAKLLLSAIIM